MTPDLMQSLSQAVTALIVALLVVVANSITTWLQTRKLSRKADRVYEQTNGRIDFWRQEQAELLIRLTAQAHARGFAAGRAAGRAAAETLDDHEQPPGPAAGAPPSPRPSGAGAYPGGGTA